MTTAKLDFLNIGLMLAALGLASAFPYEVFLVAYAFLGPLHYVTEISWLHDRKNFCTHRVDAFLLILPTFFVFLGLGVLFKVWHSPFFAAFAPEIMVFTFLSALIYLTVKNAWKRIVALLLVIGATILFSISDGSSHGGGYWNLRYWVGLYLPSLIHVFVFTAVFIFLGALRNRSWTGIASLVVFVLAAGFCFFNPFVGRIHAPGSWAKTNFAVFAPLNSGLCFLFKLHQSDSTDPLVPFHNLEELYNSPAALKAMTFIAFAYVYHYMNWFSKTSVIGWHRISRKRIILIIAVWLASAGLYLWSYEAGLLWLAVLSLSHVTLEFPLNWLSFKECAFRGAAIVGLRRSVGVRGA
jgi:hypothetical protein